MSVANMHKGRKQEQRKMNQKEAVYDAIEQVVGEVEEGSNINRTITSEQRKDIVDMLVDGFKNDQIMLATEFPSDQALRTYCTGLLSNWLRKDTRLNGGDKYVPKHPGRGRGVGSDAQLKALNALLNQVSDPADKAEIQEYIDARKAEIAPAQTYKNVDFNVLPEGLRTKFSSGAAKKLHSA